MYIFRVLRQRRGNVVGRCADVRGQSDLRSKVKSDLRGTRSDPRETRTFGILAHWVNHMSASGLAANG
ncbi:hypothetical protein Y032_0075g918 [Ancylostoma ceylanicum]|uniref:Uncharacterized protein n=1 Tax=Ancylostoma ceylanicum TaxID=53326 RepID=A0A016TV15_9BILA|nr:hypothetical protein Y032_0075g918 [Ancylostoma ceylanicum]